MRGDQCDELIVKRRAVFGIDPVAVLRLEVEPPRTCGHPDFTRDPVAVDDDLAAIVELDFKYAIGRRLEIQIGCFQHLFDVSQRHAGGLVEFGLAGFGLVWFDWRHGVPC